MGVYVEVRGLDPLLVKLGRVDDLISELAEPTRETLDLLKGRVRDYPPSPAGSKYVRTYRLKNGWQEMLILSGSILGRVASFGVPYAQLVQDRERQAQIHQGRWQTRQDVAAESEDEVVVIYETYLQALINK